MCKKLAGSFANSDNYLYKCSKDRLCKKGRSFFIFIIFHNKEVYLHHI